MSGALTVEGAGGIYEKFSEIGFLVVSDRGDRHQLDAVGPMKKILFLVEVITTWRSALQCNCIVLVIFNHAP